MSKILDQLPYLDAGGFIEVEASRIPVLAHQIVVWVSITPKTVLDWNPSARRIPAILDTGNTFGFSITEEHLVRWCGIEPRMLDVLGPVFINRERLSRHAGDIWIHRNKRQQRDAFQRGHPVRLELRDGIAFTQQVCRCQHRACHCWLGEKVGCGRAGRGLQVPTPRLPLLGLRAIDENELRCTIDGLRRTVSLAKA